MKEGRIIRGRKGMKSKTDWARLDKMTDDEIDYSDSPETNEEFWANAELIIPENKIKLGIRLDKVVVDWFKKQGPGYQSRMNSVLKTYVEAQRIRTSKQKLKKKAS